MVDRDLVHKIRKFKIERGYTLHELSAIIGVQVSTIERWLRTDRINKLYADLVRVKLRL